MDEKKTQPAKPVKPANLSATNPAARFTPQGGYSNLGNGGYRRYIPRPKY